MALMDFKLGDIGGVFTSIREAITGEKIEDPTEILKQVAILEVEFLKARSDIIIAEAKSEHWLTSTWRPITMLTFVFIIANNYILAPYISAIFSCQMPTLELTAEMWELIKVGLGGYVVSRGAEKVAREWKK